MSRIALIHATPVAIAPVVAAFAAEWPAAEIANLLDDSLSADLDRAGHLDQGMIDRFGRLARYVADCGCEGILFTCSAFGEAIEKAAMDLAPMPVLKPNEAMFEAALAMGSNIGLLATFAPSLPPMRREFEALSQTSGKTARLKTACVPEAMDALRRGDSPAHDALVADAAAQFEACDVLMLAQFSTAQARSAVAETLSQPVLTSPASAVRKMKRLLGA